jgi:rSAM/selenodomain-associated transferase 1
VSYFKKLGIFARVPEAGRVKTRLVPPLSPDEACRLYEAMLRDLFSRLSRLKKTQVTVFYAGDDPEPLRELLPAGTTRVSLEAQRGDALGDRLHHAFEHLLESERDVAAIIGSDSPDLPIPYLKRAFLKLKHKDVVLGPASDGGYYLIGLRRPVPGLLDGISWGTEAAFEDTLRQVSDHGLSCSLLPLWYDVDDIHSLALLRSMMIGRRIEKSCRLPHTERFLDTLPALDRPQS